MRILLVLCVPLVFLLGRLSAASPTDSRPREQSFVARNFGDEFRVPAASTRCFVSGEGGATNVHCAHVPFAKAQYEVVFYRDNLFVYRFGDPENPVFSARGRP